MTLVMVFSESKVNNDATKIISELTSFVISVLVICGSTAVTGSDFDNIQEVANVLHDIADGERHLLGFSNLDGSIGKRM
jgi:hypothetical protein